MVRLGLIAAAVGVLVLGWTATAQAQATGPPPTPAPETTAAPTRTEILSRHLHLLTPQEPTPEGILAPEPPSELASPLLRRTIPGLAEGIGAAAAILPRYVAQAPSALVLLQSSQQ